MDCYAKKYNKLLKCKECMYKQYCKEAVYRTKNTVDLDKLDNYKEFAAKKVSKEKLTYISNFSKILSELLHLTDKNGCEKYDIMNLLVGLVHIYKESEEAYRITLMKLVNPNMSYTDIGNEIGISKQLVAFHLLRAKILFPVIESSIVIDTRRFPKTKKESIILKIEHPYLFDLNKDLNYKYKE